MSSKRKISSTALPTASGKVTVKLAGDWRTLGVHVINTTFQSHAHLLVEESTQPVRANSVTFYVHELGNEFTLEPGHEFIGVYEQGVRTLVVYGPRQSQPASALAAVATSARTDSTSTGPGTHSTSAALGQVPPGGYHG